MLFHICHFLEHMLRVKIPRSKSMSSTAFYTCYQYIDTSTFSVILPSVYLSLLATPCQKAIMSVLPLNYMYFTSNPVLGHWDNAIDVI